MRSKFTIIILFLLVATTVNTQEIAEPPINVFEFNKSVNWQKAKPQDINVFDMFIGRFKSKSRFSNVLKENIHFILEYKWFDEQKTTVKLVLSYVIENTDKETIHSEGFYGFDPSTNRLYLMQTYASGAISFGGIEQFNIKTGRRLVRAYSINKKGEINDVRDEFEVIDINNWKNIMYSLENGKWKIMYEDTFTRLTNR